MHVGKKPILELAVFGDSYADNKGPRPHEGWHQALCKINGWDMHTQTVNTGESGAGNWWGYINLLHYVKTHKIRNVVFSLTDIKRLPIASPNGANFAYEYGGYIHQKQNGNPGDDKRFVSYLNSKKHIGPDEQYPPGNIMEMWYDLFSEPHQPHLLAEFINTQVRAAVEKVCLDNNINCVFFVPFVHDVESYGIYNKDHINYHTIIGLDTVSAKEQHRDDPNVDRIVWHTQADNDERTNHFMQHHNVLLAHEINRGLSGTKELVKFDENPGLDYSIEKMQEYGTFVYKS